MNRESIAEWVYYDLAWKPFILEQNVIVIASFEIEK